MKRSRKTNIALVAIGLILMLSLFFANKIITKPGSQTAIDTLSTAISPSPDVGITATYIASLLRFPTPVGIESPATQVIPTPTSSLAPPQCTFPLSQTTVAETMPEQYTFSEPEVVLTAELQPDIVGWLPDNQNVLLMPVKLIDLGMNGYRQTIELFNPETRETSIYATRRAVDEAPPAWSPVLHAIVYSDTKVLEGSTITDFRFTRQVRISYGNTEESDLLADNLPQYSMGVKPDGTQIAYFLDNQLMRLDGALKPLAPVTFDRKRWDYLHENDKVVEEYKMAWRPNSEQIFLYNHATDGLGYTYILDTDTGRLCNLNFGGWAKSTQWSQNGRYLAIVRAQGAVPIRSSDVSVLDTTTGEYYGFSVTDLEIEEGFVQDIAWAPDNRHLLFTVETTYSQSTFTYGGLLYLGDFISGQAESILSSYQFNIDAGSTNLAWSPDGSKLLMNCPTSEGIKQVCFISVKAGGQ